RAESAVDPLLASSRRALPFISRLAERKPKIELRRHRTAPAPVVDGAAEILLQRTFAQQPQHIIVAGVGVTAHAEPVDAGPRLQFDIDIAQDDAVKNARARRLDPRAAVIDPDKIGRTTGRERA